MSERLVTLAFLAYVPAEVVLTILLGSFKFSLPKQEIVWNLAGVKYPTVGRASTKPSMPIVVERIREA